MRLYSPNRNLLPGGRHSHWLSSLIVMGILVTGVAAQEELPGPSSNTPTSTIIQPAPAVTAMDLAGCIRMGLGNQPSIRAAQASLNAAHASQHALHNIGCIAEMLARDLPVRRQQAHVATNIAASEVHKMEWETTYAVTRMYWSLQYARAQEKVVQELLTSMKSYRDVAAEAIDGGDPKFSKTDLDKLDIFMGIYKTRLIKAQQGSQRTLAALKEAIGLGCDTPFDVITEDLPELGSPLDKNHLVSLAVARRAEMIQSTGLVEVTRLEVCAQSRIRGYQGKTFAAGGDIHAKAIPSGSNGEEYRPAAILPEMPTLLAGKKADRMQRAQTFVDRAQAMVAKTKNLIVLEAENAYHQWKEAEEKAETLTPVQEKAKNLVQTTEKGYRAFGRTTVDELLKVQGMSLQVRAELNQALFEHALALAALERITAGGFVPLYRQGTVIQPMAPAPAQNVNPMNGNNAQANQGVILPTEQGVILPTEQGNVVPPEGAIIAPDGAILLQP